MNDGSIRGATLARLFGITLVIAGLVAIAWFVGRSFYPAVPGLPAQWMTAVEAWLPLHRLPWIAHPTHIEIFVALAGLALMWRGSTITADQSAVFEAAKLAAEDRLRRVRAYGGDGRIEPFIGAPIPMRPDTEPR